MLSLNLFQSTIKNTFNLNSNASREEFWNFQILSTILTIFSLFFMLAIYSLPSLIFFLIFITAFIFIMFMVVVNLSVSIRRLNDLNQPKILILISFLPIIGLIFFYGYLGFATKSKK
ncbi:DUF805 domain-containing protein [archaeon]|nr:DUF805 domain-containing protein [archaeon]